MQKASYYSYLTIFVVLAISLILSCSSSTDTETPDTTAPTITAFTLTGDLVTAKRTVTFDISATDDVGVTGWFLSETDATPEAGDADWTDTKPTDHEVSTGHAVKTIYIWAKDAAGNISESASISVTYVSDATEDTDNWDKKYDADDDSDFVQSIAIDSQGNVYVGGYAFNLASDSSGVDWWIKKYSKNGVEDTTNWDKKLDIGTSSGDYLRSIALDSNDNLFAAGTSNMDWIIKKFSSDGTEDTTNWNKTIDGGNNDILWALKVDSSDNIYAAGCGHSVATASTNYDWWLKKFDKDGNEDTSGWDKKINGLDNTNDCARAIEIDYTGNVYVAGHTWDAVVPNTSGRDWWIKKFTPTGTEIGSGWNKTFDSNLGNDYAYSIAIDSENNVYVAGAGEDFESTGTGQDIWIKKFTSGGDQDTTNWDIKLDSGSKGEDAVYSIKVDSKDNVYVGGCVENVVDTTSGLDWWLRKYSSDGEVQGAWNKMFDANFGDDSIYALAVDANDNIYAGGTGSNMITGTSASDWWIKKFLSE